MRGSIEKAERETAHRAMPGISFTAVFILNQGGFKMLLCELFSFIPLSTCISISQSLQEIVQLLKEDPTMVDGTIPWQVDDMETDSSIS